MGVNPWVDSLSYPKFATVYSDNGVWISLVDDNVRHEPSTAESYWKLIYDINGPVVTIPSTDLSDVWTAIYDINIKIDELSGYITSGSPTPTPTSECVTEISSNGKNTTMSLDAFYTAANAVDIFFKVSFVSLDNSLYYTESGYKTKSHPFILFGSNYAQTMGIWSSSGSSVPDQITLSDLRRNIKTWTFTTDPFWIGVRWDANSYSPSEGIYIVDNTCVASDIDSIQWDAYAKQKYSNIAYSNQIMFTPRYGVSLKWYEIRVVDTNTNTTTRILPYKTSTSVYWKTTDGVVVNATTLGDTFV